MAEADPDSSDTSDVKPISSSAQPLFSIPRFFVTKDSDAAAGAGRSPTSPLDFSLFGGLFRPRSPPAAAPSSPRFRNRWAFDKVGLSLLSSSAGEEGSHEEGLFNIVLAPQIKPRLFNSCVKSNSLPKNYAPPSMSSEDADPPLPCDSVTEEHDSPRRSSSSPMDIISSQAYSRSLSAREMALSEDYTCIISHGPNPKTTHIFGDCILDCDPKELGTNDETEKPEGDDDSFLCLCTDKAQNHIHMHRSGSYLNDNDHREICGLKLRENNISVFKNLSSEASSAAVAEEKESDKGGVEDCLEISPGSSYNEDLFPMAS